MWRSMVFRDERRQTVLVGSLRFAESESAAIAGERPVRPEKRVKRKLRAASQNLARAETSVDWESGSLHERSDRHQAALSAVRR